MSDVIAWKDTVPAEELARWNQVCSEADHALLGSALPEGVGALELMRTVLTVADAKGLVYYRLEGDQIDVRFTLAGHSLAPSICALGAGRFDAWAVCVKAVRDASAVPRSDTIPQSIPPLEAGAAAPMSLSPHDARMCFDRIRVLHPKIATGEYRLAVGPAGAPTHILWVPSDGPMPPPTPNALAVEARRPDGKAALCILLAALPDILTFAAVDEGLANTIKSGDNVAVVPMPGQEGLWMLFERLRQPSGLDIAELTVALDRLVARPARDID